MSTPAEPTVAQFTHPVVRYVAAIRPLFLSATLVACLIGIACAAHDGAALDVPRAALTIALALLVHAAANVLNDYHDALDGCDAINHERLYPYTGGSRLIQNGILTPHQTARFGHGLLACAVLGGLWLVPQVGIGLLLIGAVGLFLAWAYSATPFRLSGRGLGEFCVLAGFLGAVVGADFVQRGSFDRAPVLVGLPYALLVTNLLYVNQFPDRKADAATGKRHWVARLPLAQAVRVYPLLTGVAFGILITLHWRGTIPSAALVSALPLLLSLAAAAHLKRYATQPARLRPAIQLTIAAMLSHGILLTIALMGTS
jgi:1,4-dihydroxy-2-naphthoate octaprenyltransferase